MRTAKALQKIKHINHMKNAIRHHEATRAKKDPIFKERFNAKQARLQEEQYHAKYTRGDVKKAKRNYKEDWALGPLRPNRAVGENAELYGAMEKDQLRWPDVPIPTQRMRNKLREKAGLDPEWPIVMDDRKVYPFAKGDRVVVIRGKEMNKIGIIENINEEAHVVELKDVNKAYVDSSIFALMGAPQEDAKREFDFPFNVNDLRLVVPMTVTELHDGRPVKVQQDVIVDKITLERYTRGVDPYTGTRTYKNTIPEEHRKDPKTDLPIYHRYIAGTRHVIEWPLEASVDDLGVPEEEATNTPEESRGIGGSVRKGLSVLASPFSRTRARPALESGLFSKSKKPEDDTLAAAEEEANEYRPRQPLYTPKEIEREPLPYSDVAEAPEYSAPQDQLIDTADILPRQQSSAKAQEDRATSDELKVRTKPRILKTPQQLVWEYEARQRRKTTFVHHNQRPKLPVDLLTAIGMHMEKNGVKAPPRSGRDTEVD